ncbi:DNA-processing protein DprA [bacterium]|nr:DNA-processing protein DprA [bacterium]
MHELVHLLQLISVPGIGNQRARNLIQRFGSPQNVMKADIHELREVGLVDEKTANSIRQGMNADYAEKQLESAEKLGVDFCSIWDEKYPELLKKIHDPPVLLFTKGNGNFCVERSIAVVGTRAPSAYGRRMSELLASNLVQHQITVVSGLARGIDTAAHSGVLKSGGKTIAVLGCGINVVYPPENIKLYDRIQEEGLLVSEFPLDEQPLAGHFPRRNRIISGLSLGTVVIEAGERSGALITAYMALEQGREVFALPGHVGQKLSRGPHRLIKEGAKLIECVEDIIDEIPSLKSEVQEKRRNHIVNNLSVIEKKIWQALSDEPKHIDAVSAELELSTSELLAYLLSMELKNYIRQLSGMKFVRQ